MKHCYNCFLVIVLSAWIAGCDKKSDPLAGAGSIGVTWELVSNFTEEENIFEARFSIDNKSGITLNAANWALFFSVVPRPIVENETPQPAGVQHINGDWYKLVPEKDFSLAPGDTLAITYRGRYGMIKETDAPSGLYFVFYDEAGAEQKIVPVSDYRVMPFTRPEQVARSKADGVPVPTPALQYDWNKPVHLLQPAQIQQIVPSPVRILPGSGTIAVSPQMEIQHEAGLAGEADYLAAGLKELTGNEFTVTENIAAGPAIQLKTGDVSVNGLGGEAYVLAISSNGITITGSDPAGVFYGIQSLRALIPLQAWQKPAPSFSLPCLTVEDAPRFAFRGQHVDVARNFHSKETVRRILDVLSFYKINRLLLHLTEDEGWRLEIEGLPELTQVGSHRQHAAGKEAPVLHPAYGSGPVAGGEANYGAGYYSKEDFIGILEYAKARHIKVIPEVNFPGHARAAIKAMEARYERLMSEGKEAEANEYRLIDPDDRSEYLSAQFYTDNVVNVAGEAAYHFYEKVVDEIAAMYDAAGLTLDEFHTGGDEVAQGAWTKSPMAAALLAEHPEIKGYGNLQAYFFKKLLPRLEKRNLRVGGWEEVAIMKAEDGGYLPNAELAGRDVVPFIWNNLFDYPDMGYRLANAGYKVVLCNVSNFYFDLAYNKDPTEPGLYWGGFVNTRNAWTFAPFDMFTTTRYNPTGLPMDYTNVEHLKPEARKNILGLEAQLWSETIKGPAMVEYYMLPKLMGFAESAWAPERNWETIAYEPARSVAMDKEWNVFANTLAQKELPRLGYMNGGYNYRVPPPGAVVKEGKLHANVAFPGLSIRYTTDGSEPDVNSTLYREPIAVSGRVLLKSFDSAGKASSTTEVMP